MIKEVEVSIYGAEQICASCVNLPSSKDTYEWLQAAIGRKFPDQKFSIKYYDIFQPPADEAKNAFCKRVIEEDLFYPVVVIEGEIIGEGNPRLKSIYAEFEKYGYISM
ncbi:YuzD family protein [Niallia sp. NCCP-28]|uniref:YuzD family protein n=1 Tax=Niallia sp. NCCP-28 TaxID=2934712 RepID=UPI00207FA12B|nr:YuzD family protein [Niallia sp. NCCP-28]GKU83190.1 putative disulfide oxidoreductase YuzD [Niallia sp. NCCP-28]